jgi:hypothetical protein
VSLEVEIKRITAVTTGMERFTFIGQGTEQLRNRRDTRYKYVGLIIGTVEAQFNYTVLVFIS